MCVQEGLGKSARPEPGTPRGRRRPPLAISPLPAGPTGRRRAAAGTVAEGGASMRAGPPAAPRCRFSSSCRGGQGMWRPGASPVWRLSRPLPVGPTPDPLPGEERHTLRSMVCSSDCNRSVSSRRSHWILGQSWAAAQRGVRRGAQQATVDRNLKLPARPCPPHPGWLLSWGVNHSLKEEADVQFFGLLHTRVCTTFTGKMFRHIHSFEA